MLGVGHELTATAWVCVISPRQIEQDISVAARYLTMKPFDENESTTVHSVGGQKGKSAWVLAAGERSVEPREACASTIRLRQGTVSVARRKCLLMGSLHPPGITVVRVMMHMIGDAQRRREEGEVDSKPKSTKRKLLWDDPSRYLTGSSDKKRLTNGIDLFWHRLNQN